MQPKIRNKASRENVIVDSNRVRQAFELLENEKIINWYMRIDGILTRDFLTTIAVSFGAKNKLAFFQYMGSQKCNGNIEYIGNLGVMANFNFGFDCPRSFVRAGIIQSLNQIKNETNCHEQSCIQPNLLDLNKIKESLDELKKIGKINWYTRIDGFLTQDLFATFVTGIGKGDKICCFQFFGSENYSNDIKLIDRSGAMESFNLNPNCLSISIQTELMRCIDQKIQAWDFEERCIKRLDLLFKKMYLKDNSFPFFGVEQSNTSEDVNHVTDCWILCSEGKIPLQIKYNIGKLAEHNKKHPEIPGWYYCEDFSDKEIIFQIKEIYIRYLNK